jgi:hypothetical protein
MDKERLQNEYILKTLRETAKKIADLKEFNVPVILKAIEEYEKAGAQECFIEQQKALLDKVYTHIAELEDKAGRLLERLK